jgi:Na+/proline symporter
VRSIAPKGDRSSFSEFFRRRYSPAVGVAVGVAIAFLYFFYLAAQFKALGGMLEVWGGWDTRLAGIAAALLVIWMTAGAGIRSDMYTDVIHFWAMAITIAAGVAIEVSEQGGFRGIVSILEARQQWQSLMNPYTFAGPAFVWLGIATGRFSACRRWRTGSVSMRPATRARPAARSCGRAS